MYKKLIQHGAYKPFLDKVKHCFNCVTYYKVTNLPFI